MFCIDREFYPESECGGGVGHVSGIGKMRSEQRIWV